MARQVDLKAAKAARQKKIAIGGAVLLAALLAWQVPKTMKMLSPPRPQSSSSIETTASTAPAATALGSTRAATGAAPSASSVALVLKAPLAPAAREGQLEELSPTFTSKDPFAPQIKEHEDVVQVPAGPAPAAKTPTGSPRVVPSSVPKPNAQSASTTSAPSAAPAAPAPAATPPAKKAAPVPAEPYVSATIAVNGTEEGVNVKADFPVAGPFFHLVSLTAKTARISIAGGSLAGGASTLTLKRGKPLTLVNTADGTRYRLVLVATSHSAATAPPAEAPAQPSTTTTPTTTAG